MNQKLTHILKNGKDKSKSGYGFLKEKSGGSSGWSHINFHNESKSG